jgi:hypothetical protein
MPIADELAAVILARCARHCCICRRFAPLHIQVHHIIEQSAGGTDDSDNLIAICLTCHSDVHTRTQFTRRFTVTELKLHRDAVYRLVAEGVLPSDNQRADRTAELSATIIRQLQDFQPSGPKLPVPHRSMEILLAAVCERSPIHQYQHESGGVELRVGKQSFYFHAGVTGATPASVPEPLKTLLEQGLARETLGRFEITDAGMILAEELLAASAAGRFTMTKVKCLTCSLHFIICTWHPERHRRANVTCPECGSRNGRFAMWQQQQFGDIFRHVPGTARLLED